MRDKAFLRRFEKVDVSEPTEEMTVQILLKTLPKLEKQTGVIFVDLRDYYGTLQLVSNDDKMFDDLTRESSVTVTGKIRKRDSDDYNDRIETGTIELLVSSIKVLGKSKNVLPFEVMTSKDVSEDVRLKYR